jgi:hypothetical protein
MKKKIAKVIMLPDAKRAYSQGDLVMATKNAPSSNSRFNLYKKGFLCIAAGGMFQNYDFHRQHLYIVSVTDSTLKIGDWVFVGSEIIQIKTYGQVAESFGREQIIATTNASLRVDRNKRVSTVPLAFIRMYIQAHNNGIPIKNVLVAYKEAVLGYDDDGVADIKSVPVLSKQNGSIVLAIPPNKPKQLTKADLWTAFYEGASIVNNGRTNRVNWEESFKTWLKQNYPNHV